MAIDLIDYINAHDLSNMILIGHSLGARGIIKTCLEFNHIL